MKLSIIGQCYVTPTLIWSGLDVLTNHEAPPVLLYAQFPVKPEPEPSPVIWELNDQLNRPVGAVSTTQYVEPAVKGMPLALVNVVGVSVLENVVGAVSVAIGVPGCELESE